MNQSPQLNDSEKWAYVVARWHNEATQKLLDWAGLIERSYLAAPNPGDFLKGMAPKTIPGWAAGYLNDLESLADEIKKRATWGTPEYEKDSLPARDPARIALATIEEEPEE